MKSLTSLNHTIYNAAFVAFLFFLPLFFLPLTANYFDTNKLALIVGFALYSLVAWAFHIIATRAFKLTLSATTLPLLLLGLAVILSSFLNGPNPYLHLLGKGSLLPALCLIALLSPTLISSKRTVVYGFYALLSGAAILSLIGIFQSLGFGLSNLLNRFFALNIPNTLAFTPAGSPAAALTYLAPLIAGTLILAFTKKDSLEKVVYFLVAAIMTSGFVLTLIYAFPGKDTAPIFLPPREGYAIMLETLKDPKKALIGFGPESFVVAYNRLRPANLNLTKYWNVRFTNSSTELFDSVTTTGVLGLLAWIYLAASFVKSAKAHLNPTQNVIKVAGLFSLFLLILVPASYLHYFTIFMLLALWTTALKFADLGVRNLDADLSSVTLVRPGASGENQQSAINILPYLTALPLVVMAGAGGYYTYKAYTAEVTFKQALDAAANNQGVETYNAQREAIAQLPSVPRYRRAYAATNLALANSVAGKKDLTDKDRQDITTLIQQAIREAKAAVTLEPDNAANWENLTFVYKSLIGIAQNSDQWTIAAIAQAIKNDPVNPRLRLELGGIYYSLNRYDQAIRFYQQAAELKPDWANAYYNLAAAHKQKKELTQAYDYLRQVIALVEPNTADYTKAQTEIQELADQLKLNQPETTNPAQGELNVPAPVPTTRPADQVNLPENAGPAEIAPSPAPESLPTPAPSP